MYLSLFFLLSYLFFKILFCLKFSSFSPHRFFSITHLGCQKRFGILPNYNGIFRLVFKCFRASINFPLQAFEPFVNRSTRDNKHTRQYLQNVQRFILSRAFLLDESIKVLNLLVWLLRRDYFFTSWGFSSKK